MKTNNLPVKGGGRGIVLITLGVGVIGAASLAWPLHGTRAGFVGLDAGTLRSKTVVATADRPLAANYPQELPPDISARTLVPPRLRAILAATSAEADADAREVLMAGLVADMTEDDLKPALAFLAQQPPSVSIAGIQSQLLCHWAETDPRSAASAALETDPQNRQKILNSVIGVWADAALTDAIAWAHELPDDEFKGGVLLSVAYEAARSQPELAIELAGPLSPSPERDRFLAHAVAQWAARAPEAAASWTMGAADGRLRQRLQTAVAVAWSDSDPIEAATFALHSMTPGKSQDETLIGIVQRWSQKDPVGVAALIEMFPPGAMHESALENLTKLWARRDPKSAGDWLNTLSPGAARDVAMRSYLEITRPGL